MATFAKIMAAAAVVPLFWFTVNADGARFCPTNTAGDLVAYSVQRPDQFDVLQTLTFDGAAQSLWCSNVAEVPVR
jgi:hypothetical protein